MTAPSNAVEIRVLLRMCCINSRKKSPPSAKRALHPQKEPYLSFNRALHPQKEPCISAKRAIYNRTQQRDQDQSPAAHVLRLWPQPQPAPRVVLHVYVCVCRRVHIRVGGCGWVWVGGCDVRLRVCVSFREMYGPFCGYIWFDMRLCVCVNSDTVLHQ